MNNRVLYDEKTGEKAKLPVMPIIVAMDGLVCEACSIKEAAAIFIGNHYYDSPDENLDWNLRVEAARKECMKALSQGIEVVVFDKRQGVIQDNFAVPEDDFDYELENDNPVKIRVDNDTIFLLSLASLGAIRLLEREDSFLFRPDPDEIWIKNDIKEYSGGSYIDIYQQYNINELIESFS